jgi:hypothetical protein
MVVLHELEVYRRLEASRNLQFTLPGTVHCTVICLDPNLSRLLHPSVTGTEYWSTVVHILANAHLMYVCSMYREASMSRVKISDVPGTGTMFQELEQLMRVGCFEESASQPLPPG